MEDTDSETEEVATDEELVKRQPSSIDDKHTLPRVAEEEHGSPDKRRGYLSHYARRRSIAAVLAIVRLVRTRERIWTTAISSAIASILMLLVGFTLGFPSASVLQLRKLPGSRQFDTIQIDLYVVTKSLFS